MILRNIKCVQKILYASIHHNSPVVFENTVVYWALQHFKSDSKYQTHIVNNTVNRSADKIRLLKDTHYLSSIKTDELLSHMIIVSKNLIRDTNVLINVDQELCKRLNNEEYKTILSITDTLLYFTHNRTHLIKSYKICIELIENILRYEEISLQHFIQCTFYTSILKDDPLARVIMELILSKVHMQTTILHTISPIELGIFCNSVYKTSTKIKSKKILMAIVKALDKDANTLLQAPELGISVLKPLHQGKYSDYTVLKKLSKAIMKKNINVDNYEFTSIVYLLKLFANALYNDKALINYLAKSAIAKLKNMYTNKEYIRAKDISILLKSFCELGSNFLKPLVADNVIPILYDAVDNKKIQKNELKSLTEILLWISILDASIFSKAFLHRTICKDLFTLAKNDVKNIARNNLLLTILSTEQLLPVSEENQLLQLIEPTDGYDLDQLSVKRPMVYKIYQAAHCLSVTNKSVILNVEAECQIPNLYLPGVTVQTERLDKIAIESLDEKVCLHDTLIPNGYMKLKMRLLKKLGYKVITIPQDIDYEGSEHLFTAIEDNITRLNHEEKLNFFKKQLFK